MKRAELIKRIAEMDCILIRHGKRHDWYQNPVTRMLNKTLQRVAYSHR